MGYRLTKTLVLVGLMGAGKTVIGTLVAEKLGVPFVDSDEELVRAANMSISEIFERDGEPFFRMKERQVIARLLEEQTCVLSTGGGAYINEETRAAVHDHGFVVWLKVDLDLLWQRVSKKDTRPLLAGPNGREVLRDLYEARYPIYAEADLTVEAEARLSKAEMADKVVAALLADPNSGVVEEVTHG